MKPLAKISEEKFNCDDNSREDIGLLQGQGLLKLNATVLGTELLALGLDFGLLLN